MLILVTGVPGASKTLNTIKMVLSEDRFKNRPVYFAGINGCVVPGWSELTYDQAKNWETVLPADSVLVVDEARKFAPVGPTGVEPPSYISQIAEHRHLGVDLILIVQHGTMLHTFVRKMCGNYFHYERAFGFERARRLEWQKYVDPDDHFARKDAVVKNVKFDRSIYKLYKSAEVHTHVRRIPKKLVVILLLLGVCVGLFGFLAHRLKNHDVIAAGGSVLPSTGLSMGSERHTLTREQYIAQFQPRIPGLAYTAPVYDQAFKVKTFPKPNCVINNSTQECRCYSQQGTRLEVEPESCARFAVLGWFDPTKDESRDRDNEYRNNNQRVLPNSYPTGQWVDLGNSHNPGTFDTPIDGGATVQQATPISSPLVRPLLRGNSI